jgi:hypothetical protein
MTTTDSSFVAQGPAAIGFSAKASKPANPFKFGALAVGHETGVYGAIDDIATPPTQRIWDQAGVVGTSNNKHGVFGISWTLCGVMGQWGVKPALLQSSSPPPARAGVMGLAADADGVVGASDHGIGVAGQSQWASGVTGDSTYAIGVDASTDVGDAAIRGQAIAGNGIGVVAVAATNSGVFGMSGSGGPAVPNVPNIAGVVGSSDAQFGVIGKSNTATGVVGYSKNSIGVVGQTSNPGSFAGFFIGNVHMTGTLSSDVPKGTVVPFPDGTRRLLYCMESPEVWFEDFGTAKLRRGRTVVRLDADFAKVIKPDYRVFLTPEGDCRGLFVRRKNAASFEVRELMGGKSSIAFSYRIVGRRKDIKERRRFERIDTQLPLLRARTAQPARRARIPHPTPAELRAFAARMEKLAAAQPKRGGKRKRSAR